MTKKNIIALLMVVILMVSLVGTVSADAELPADTPITDPVEDPNETVEETGTARSKFFTHPVVKLLDAYFGKTIVVVEETEATDGDPVDPSDPAVTDPTETDPTAPTPAESLSGLTQVGEEIAAYHEDGMGFGQLVKIYAMVQASQEACASQQPAETAAGAAEEGDPVTEACVALTAEELVAQVRSGTGMGELFKEYGKPAMLGVGHVKKAVKNQPDTAVTPEPTDEDPTVEDPSDEATVETAGQESGKDKQDKVNGGKPEDKGNKPAKEQQEKTKSTTSKAKGRSK